MTQATTLAPSSEAPAYVDDVVRKSGTSFYWAMRLLPPEKRRAMFAVYAFCREVDDVADGDDDVTEKRQQLQAWRQDIDALFDGRGASPVTAALISPVDSFALRREDFAAVIDGMDMDAEEAVRIADLDELLLYCDRVACAVGRLSVRIFGLTQPIGDQLADTLGRALQLTNILRDVHEDSERDRLYLPADMLREAGVPDGPSAAAVLAHPRISDVCSRLAELARQSFAEAAECIAACDRRQVRPAVVMMQVYRRCFKRLNRRGWERWAEPVSVPTAEKLWVAVRYGLL